MTTKNVQAALDQVDAGDVVASVLQKDGTKSPSSRALLALPRVITV
jgi:hypothetical protein